MAGSRASDPAHRFALDHGVRSGERVAAAKGALAGTNIAGAQTSTATPSASAAATKADSATMKHGPGETLLTDGTATKVKAAALKAVPGGTVLRVETDSAGSPYEAHVRKADGTVVTVKVGKDFQVASTESGFGSGGADRSN